MQSGNGDLAIATSKAIDDTSTHSNVEMIRAGRDAIIQQEARRKMIDDALTSFDLARIVALHKANETLYAGDLFRLVTTFSLSHTKPDVSAIISYLAIHFPTIVLNEKLGKEDLRTLYATLTMHGVSKKALSHLKAREELTTVYHFIRTLEKNYHMLGKFVFVTDSLDDVVYPDLERLITSSHPLLSAVDFVAVATMQRVMNDTMPKPILDPFMDLVDRANRYAKRANEIDFIVKMYEKKIQPMLKLKQIYRDAVYTDGGRVDWYFSARHHYRLSIARPINETNFIHAFFELMLDSKTYSISDPKESDRDIFLDIDHKTAIESTVLLTDVSYHHLTYRKFMNMIDSIIVLLERVSSRNELVWSNNLFELRIDPECVEILTPLLDYCDPSTDDDPDKMSIYTIDAMDLLDVFYEESAIHEIDGLLTEREFKRALEPEKRLLPSLQLFMHQISGEETPQLKLLEAKKSDSMIALPLGSLHVELLKLHLANHGCLPVSSNALCVKMKCTSLKPAVTKILQQSGGWPHLVTNIKWLNTFLKLNKELYLTAYSDGHLNLTCLKQGIGSYLLSRLLQLPFVVKVSKCEYRLSLAAIANIPNALMESIMLDAHERAKSDNLDYLYQFRQAALINSDTEGHFSPDGNLYLSIKQERAVVLKPLLDNFEYVEASPDVMALDIEEIWGAYDVDYDVVSANAEQRLRQVNRIIAIISQFNKPKRIYQLDGIFVQFTDQDIEKRFSKVISFATKSDLGYKIPYSIIFRLSNDALAFLEYTIKHQSPQAFQKRQQDYQKVLGQLLHVSTTWQRVNEELRTTYKGYDSNCVKWLLERLDIDGIELGAGQPLPLSMHVEKLPVREQIEFDILVREIIESRLKIRLVEELAGRVAASAPTSLCLTERGITFTFKNRDSLEHFYSACQHIFGQLSPEKLSVCIPYSTCVAIDVSELQTARNSLARCMAPVKATEDAHSPKIMRHASSSVKKTSKAVKDNHKSKVVAAKTKKATHNKTKNKNKSSKTSKASASPPTPAMVSAVVQQKVIVEKLPPVEHVTADVRMLVALTSTQIDFCSVESKPKAAVPQRPPSPVEVMVVDGYEYEGSLLADFNLLMTANAWFESRKVDETDIQAFHAAFWFTFVKIFNAIGTRALDKPDCVQLSDHNDRKALKVRNTILHELNEFSEVMPLNQKLMNDNFEKNLRCVTDQEKPSAPTHPLVYRNYYQGFFQTKPLVHPIEGIRSIFPRLCNIQQKYFALDSNSTQQDKEVGRRAILACIVKLSNFHKRALVEGVNVDEIAGLMPFLESIRESRNLSCHQFINNKDSGFGPLTNDTIDRIALNAKSYWELFSIVDKKSSISLDK